MADPERGKHHDPKQYDAVQRRHKRQADYVLNAEWNGYIVPIGVAHALRQPLVWTQLHNRYPWAVYWRSKKTGRRMRKLCQTLYGAIEFHQKALRVDRSATIISRGRAYDVPPELRGRIPQPWKWCPFCMKPRKFRRTTGGETFSAMVKHWSDTKQKYVWSERMLALMKCPVCRNSNRHPVFRRSNQPWEKRTFKQGAIRARRSRGMKKRARSSRRR